MRVELGRYVLAYASRLGDFGDPWELYFRRYDELGDPMEASSQANATTATNMSRPATARTSTGNFAIAWHGYDAYERNIVRVRLYGDDGSSLSSEVTVSPVDATARNPSIAALPNGRFIVVWEMVNTDGSMHIAGQRLDSDLTPIGPNP